MASGQLSPFASCADGLGFLNYTTADHRSTTSLLTPTASICTVSSLGQDDAAGRERKKTMQTKDILKSPLPHRFHLVPSGQRGRGPRMEDEGRGGKGKAQRRVRLGSPGLSGDSDVGGMGEEREEGDIFSPEASPLAPTQETASPYSPQSPFINVDPVRHHDVLIPADHFLTDDALSPVLIQSRPASICSARSAQTVASITLVQDQGSKRFSSASGSSYKEAGEKALLLSESSPILEQRDIEPPPVEVLVEADVILPEPAAGPVPQATKHDSDQESGSEIGPTIAQTNSTSLESLRSEYHAVPNKLESPHRTHRKASASTSVIPSPSPKANRRATDGNLPSPTKPSGTGSALGGKRRKFALRRQAIYAEYGFQIALPPDPDSDSAAVKVVRASPGPSPNKRSGGGRGGAGRAASAYNTLLSSGSVARLGGSSLSASVSASSSLGSGLGPLPIHSDSLASSGSGGTYRDALFASLGSSATLHGVLAHVNDRLERLSVQDDILGARRNPFPEEDDLEEGVCTSTPSARTRGLTTARLRSTGQLPGSGSGVLGAHLDENFWAGVAGSSVSSLSDWTPLRISPQKVISPVHLSLSLSVSRSERSARLSAWDVDPGHHPIVQELIDEVDRAIEQWRWILQMHVYG
ncbi:hypothetical protein FKP32DRAFT_1671284 [Trametes sanguinea]|nr:hypothetical protein FKP32DRAFT_1671284 [Trametes sanguinea]